jgi:DNA invertase Pin-like site-specific DNA recombinase
MKPSDPTLAVAYLRTSTDEQINGPKAQRHAIGAWAKRAGVRIVAWRVEHLSGGTPVEDRPRFMRALLDLREHGAGLLVVAKRDRLARDVVIAATAERLVADAHARVVTADGVTSENTPEGQLMRGLLDLFAQYERAMIRARTKAAMLAKGRRREYTGGETPYGMKVICEGEGGSVIEIGEDADEQTVIGMIRRLSVTGAGPAEIARRLNTAHVPCRGSVWHARSVSRILGRAS